MFLANSCGLSHFHVQDSFLDSWGVERRLPCCPRGCLSQYWLCRTHGSLDPLLAVADLFNANSYGLSMRVPKKTKAMDRQISGRRLWVLAVAVVKHESVVGGCIVQTHVTVKSLSLVSPSLAWCGHSCGQMVVSPTGEGVERSYQSKGWGSG